MAKLSKRNREKMKTGEVSSPETVIPETYDWGNFKIEGADGVRLSEHNVWDLFVHKTVDHYSQHPYNTKPVEYGLGTGANPDRIMWPQQNVAVHPYSYPNEIQEYPEPEEPVDPRAGFPKKKLRRIKTRV